MRHIAIFCLALSLAATSAPAQVPDGWAVVSTFAWPQLGFTGPGGLFYVPPYSSACTPVPVRGLPPEVTGASTPGAAIAGSDFVLRRPSDGALITNGWSDLSVGTQMPLFILQVRGATVTGITRYDLGTITSGGGYGVPQAYLLPDERIVVAVDPGGMTVPGEPLSGTMLGIVDPSVPPGAPGAVTAVPMQSLPGGTIDAMTVDLARGVAYIATRAGANSTVFSVPFPGGGPPTRRSGLTGAVRGMVMDNQGMLVVGGSGGTVILWSINPTTGNRVPIPNTLQIINALTVDRPTGDLLLFDLNGPSFNLPPTVHRLTPGGVQTVVCAGPAAGWGGSGGIDINPNPERFGQPTPAGNGYDWVLEPNPGGAPRVGNAGFSLTVAATAGVPIASAIVLGVGELDPPLVVPGLPPFYVNPYLPIDFRLVTSGQQMTTALPLPNIAALVGQRVFAQSFHSSANGLGASSGLRLTVLN